MVKDPSVGLTVLLTYDEPECGGAADAFVQLLEMEVHSRAEAGECTAGITVESLPIVEGEERHDFIVERTLNALIVREGDSSDAMTAPGSSSVEVIVVSFLRDHAPQQYLSIKEMCAKYQENVREVHVLTHLANYEDVSLVLRNLIRIVFHYLAEARKREREKKK